jgi:hypothetical protein
VVVDLSNSPSFDDAAVLEFFQTSGRDLLKATDGDIVLVPTAKLQP